MAEAKTEEFEEKQQQPKEETVVPESKPLENKETLWAELQKLQGDWFKMLQEGASLGYPRMARFLQDGETRWFYAISDVKKQEIGEDTAAFITRCLRDDLRVYDVKRVVRLLPFGPIVAAIEFQEVDRGELDPTSLYQLVKEIVSGSTPL